MAATHHIRGTHRRRFKGPFKVWAEPAEQRDYPLILPWVMGRLRRLHHNRSPLWVEVDVLPAEGEDLTGRAKAPVAGQGNDDAPILVGAGVDQSLGLLILLRALNT